MDDLTEMMSLLRTSGHLYGRLDLSAPFAFDFPGYKGICLIVIRGSCFLRVDKAPVRQLAAGDFVLLPNPDSYTLLSDPDLPPKTASALWPEEEFRQTRLISFDGGEGFPASIIAGCFAFASPESELLVRHLPPVIHLPGSGNMHHRGFNPPFSSSLRKRRRTCQDPARSSIGWRTLCSLLP